jgi:hypothetical protein
MFLSSRLQHALPQWHEALHCPYALHFASAGDMGSILIFSACGAG